MEGRRRTKIADGGGRFRTTNARRSAVNRTNSVAKSPKARKLPTGWHPNDKAVRL